MSLQQLITPSPVALDHKKLYSIQVEDLDVLGDATFVGSIAINQISGDLKVTGTVDAKDVKLQTLGGTPTLLNYYEEYKHTTTFSGGITVPTSTNVKVTRIGRVVTAWFESIIATGDGNTNMGMDVQFPARFLPASSGSSSTTAFIVSLVRNGTFVIGRMDVDSGGSLNITYDAATAGVTGFPNISVTWAV